MKIPEFYKRELYLDRIKPFVNTQMIKVLTGQRRVGKSFLIFQLMDYIRLSYPSSDFIYINKELFEFDGLKDYSDLVNYVTQKRNNLNDKCFLFIDEVQDITNFEKALRHFFAEGGYDIYCTGSNANMLSGELATYLSGRYIEFKVYSLTYNEFLQFHKLEDSSDSFTKFYKFGGLPYLINLPFNELLVSDYLRSIYDTIILKDVVNRYNIRNVRQLQDLTIYLADTIGNLFSANKISEYLKSQRVDLPPKTILEYLTYLNNAYFVKRLRPADIQGKRQFQIGEKYYFEDLGIRHAIRPFRPNDIGQVLENIVCHHLLVNGYNLSVGRDGDREIDFVGEKDGEKIYVQVTYSVMDPKTHEREFGNLLAIKDNYPKMVITMDELEGSSYEGIKQIPIRKFLREFK
ncbi:ATPase [Parabacteroides goldsteinii]|uniref:ATPase n=1 Tax=Parabacteroides goldsteinii TaxID=328812 RepID=A0A0J6CF03_9BACT|nr:ATP-binding protein [Parabacteroides goldsteinii]KMM30719.1 ATPase [Parabacteroides goldsteinii]